MPAVSIHPKGTDFVRLAIAKALSGGDVFEALAVATKRWGERSNVVTHIRSEIGGHTTTDPASDTLRLAAAEFLESIRGQTVLGKMTGLRRVPLKVPVALQANAAVAHWVTEGAAIPLTRTAFNRVSLEGRKAGTVIVLSKDLLRAATPEAEAVIRRDMQRAARELIDKTLLDATNAGDAGRPAAITNGVTPIGSTGALAGDLEAALSDFTGDLETACWLLHPADAALIGIRAGVAGIACDLGARGGSLAGLPAYVSDQHARAELTLTDAAGILYSDDGVSVVTSESAQLEMTDEPGAESTTPAAPTGKVVSLFQADDVALRLTRRIDWKARPGVVSRINEIDYLATAEG